MPIQFSDKSAYVRGLNFNVRSDGPKRAFFSYTPDGLDPLFYINFSTQLSRFLHTHLERVIKTVIATTKHSKLEIWRILFILVFQ